MWVYIWKRCERASMECASATTEVKPLHKILNYNKRVCHNINHLWLLSSSSYYSYWSALADNITATRACRRKKKINHTVPHRTFVKWPIPYEAGAWTVFLSYVRKARLNTTLDLKRKKPLIFFIYFFVVLGAVRSI